LFIKNLKLKLFNTNQCTTNCERVSATLIKINLS